MTEEKRALIETLNIKLSDTDKEITEKLFCAALLCADIDTVHKVIKKYNTMRGILNEA